MYTRKHSFKNLGEYYPDSVGRIRLNMLFSKRSEQFCAKNCDILIVEEDINNSFGIGI